MNTKEHTHQKCTVEIPTYDDDGTEKDSDYWVMCLKDKPCPIHDMSSSQEYNVEETREQYAERYLLSRLFEVISHYDKSPVANPPVVREAVKDIIDTLVTSLHHSHKEEVEQARREVKDKAVVEAIKGYNEEKIALVKAISERGRGSDFARINMVFRLKEIDEKIKELTPNPHSTELVPMGGEPTTAGFTKEVIKEMEDRGDTKF